MGLGVQVGHGYCNGPPVFSRGKWDPSVKESKKQHVKARDKRIMETNTKVVSKSSHLQGFG